MYQQTQALTNPLCLPQMLMAKVTHLLLSDVWHRVWHQKPREWPYRVTNLNQIIKPPPSTIERSLVKISKISLRTVEPPLPLIRTAMARMEEKSKKSWPSRDPKCSAKIKEDACRHLSAIVFQRLSLMSSSTRALECQTCLIWRSETRWHPSTSAQDHPTSRSSSRLFSTQL